MENPFELHPYDPNSEKTPIICESIVYDTGFTGQKSNSDMDDCVRLSATVWAEMDECQQLVLKTQCKACGGEPYCLNCDEYAEKTHNYRGTPHCDKCEQECDTECVHCTDGHTYLIVQDKPCEECGGDGIETCDNPDHGFIHGIGGETSRLGCPVCGHDDEFKVRGNKCEDCQGSGGVSVEGILEALWVLDKLDAPAYDNWMSKKEATQYLTYCEGIITKTE